MATGVHRRLSPGRSAGVAAHAQRVHASAATRCCASATTRCEALSRRHARRRRAWRHRCALQRSSARYFQRPDVDYVRVDPLRTSLSGAKGGVSIERQNAPPLAVAGGDRHSRRPEFETNDIGRLDDRRRPCGSTRELEYRRRCPGAGVASTRSAVGGTAQRVELRRRPADGRASVDAEASHHVAELLGDRAGRPSSTCGAQDMRLTRGGPSMERPQTWRSSLERREQRRVADAGRARAGLRPRRGRRPARSRRRPA